MTLGAVIVLVALAGQADPADVVDPAEAPAPATDEAPRERAIVVDAPPGDPLDLHDAPAPTKASPRRTGLFDDEVLFPIGAASTTTLGAAAGWGAGFLAFAVAATFMSSTGLWALIPAALALPVLGSAVGGGLGAAVFSPDLFVVVPAALVALSTGVGFAGILFLSSGNWLVGFPLLVGLPIAGVIVAGAAEGAYVAWLRGRPVVDGE